MFTPLIIFLAMAALIIVAIEWRERKKSKRKNESHDPSNQTTDVADKDLSSKSTERVMPDGSVCCGLHLVCERETLLNPTDSIIYYDDEELDQLKGVKPEQYTPEQTRMIAEVFHTMREEDVVGWVRSLQLRQIELPLDIRDEVLMIVQEQRTKKRDFA